MLPVQVEIGLRNRIGIETAIRTARRPRWLAYAAIDHHLGDVDILRLKLPRHTLHQTAQPELPHGKRGRVRIAFNALRGAEKTESYHSPL